MQGRDRSAKLPPRLRFVFEDVLASMPNGRPPAAQHLTQAQRGGRLIDCSVAVRTIRDRLWHLLPRRGFNVDVVSLRLPVRCEPALIEWIKRYNLPVRTVMFAPDELSRSPAWAPPGEGRHSGRRAAPVRLRLAGPACQQIGALVS